MPKIFGETEKELDKCFNKLKRLVKKASDWDNILFAEKALSNHLELNQAFTQDIGSNKQGSKTQRVKVMDEWMAKKIQQS